MPQNQILTVTFTELPHFHRLVAFLEEADELGEVNADEELREAVARCRADLAKLCEGEL